MQEVHLKARVDDLGTQEAWAREKGFQETADRLSVIRSDYQRQLKRLRLLTAEGLNFPDHLGASLAD